MNLAVFYPDNIRAAWSLTEGLCNNLISLGHNVTSCPIVQTELTLVRSEYPLSLDDFDAVIISGPEWIGQHVSALFPTSKAPRLGWLHESIRREDYIQLDVDRIKKSCDIIFCPAEEDQEYGFTYLPFGVDTQMFYPRHDGTGQDSKRDYDLVFIGNVYEKRTQFLNQLAPYLTGVHRSLVVGNCLVQDVTGVNIKKSMELYDQNISMIKVFLNLPSLSRLTVTKVYEVMACGAYLLHPDKADFPFACVYTSPKHAAESADFILSNWNDNQIIASQGSSDMFRKHDLKLRLRTMLQSVGVAA